MSVASRTHGTTERPSRTKLSAIENVDKLRRFDLMLRITKRVSGTESLEEVLEALVELTSQEIGCERSSFFLHDIQTSELYSRVAQGVTTREIRFHHSKGVAGAVFGSGEPIIVEDTSEDPRFNNKVDEDTGFKTESLLCVPLKTGKGDVVGVAQCLNKRTGTFTAQDRALLTEIGDQVVPALLSSQIVERMQTARAQEMDFLNIVADITSELELGSLLQRVMSEATRMLRAERSTLFLNDEKTNQLFSRVAQGEKIGEIRLPNHVGIAGAVFTSGATVNIPYAYADLRFNPSFDKQTGFFTRSILCTPVQNKQGKIIGVTQVLNKRGGPFTAEDESRLKAFTAQVAIALENAKLFDDVQKMKNYNDSMLQSMSNGVLTLDAAGKIVTCNLAGCNILKVTKESVVGHAVAELFEGKNAWVLDRIAKVTADQQPDVSMDVELEFGDNKISANVTIMLLNAGDQANLGTMIMIEDFSAEKRVKATMARYMDPAIAAQMVEKGAEMLGGSSALSTVLFSDIRGFTPITEELGAQGTVRFLNEYFTIMVECIDAEGGMLDKFIGDAIMAAFGLPIGHGDDEDRAMRASIAMIRGCHKYSAERVARGMKPCAMGIGLNTDMVVSGNIGSAKRMNYTLIGDGVNLAARLESACKQYHAQMLISENTFKRLRGTYRMRDIDLVVVKGKTEPVGVYEVLDFHTEASFPNMMDVMGYFADGIRKYRRANFTDAIRDFERCLAANPHDALSQTYIERCHTLTAHPPGDDWTGVWIMKEK